MPLRPHLTPELHRPRLESDDPHNTLEVGDEGSFPPSHASIVCSMLFTLALGVLAAQMWLTPLLPPPVPPQRIAWREASSIYCLGPVLHAVQSARLFADSKAFTDMPAVLDPHETIASFGAAFPSEHGPPNRDELQSWVSKNFLSIGSDSMFHVPADWTPRPPHLITLSNQTLRAWALELHALWLQLSRKVHPSVRAFPQRFSLLWQPHPYIVPGGRFLESYYWDSYWICLGLLRGALFETAVGIVRNALWQVREFGFVPNGGR